MDSKAQRGCLSGAAPCKAEDVGPAQARVPVLSTNQQALPSYQELCKDCATSVLISASTPGGGCIYNYCFIE